LEDVDRTLAAAEEAVAAVKDRLAHRCALGAL